MYLYYDQYGTLKTIIPHGEPVRQGGTLNVYVCFDTNRTDLWDPVHGWVGNKSLDITLTHKSGTPSGTVVMGTPRLEVFRKTMDSEVTYDLINGKTYIVVPFTNLGTQYTSVSGELWLDFLLKTTEHDETTGVYRIIDQKALGRAKIFVQQTFGYNDREVEITDDQYETLIAQLNNINGTLQGHVTDQGNPHNVTAEQVEAVAYGHAQNLSSAEKNIAKTNIDLQNVVNTGDSAVPVEGGTTKFTTGGAYTELGKKQDVIDSEHKLSADLIETTQQKQFISQGEREQILTNASNINALQNEKQDKTDSSLTTQNKTVVGGINELKSGLNNANSNIAQNTQDIAELETSKQDKLTSANAGENITITEVGGVVKINSTADGVTQWGEIQGDLEDQEDLNTALNNKVEKSSAVNKVYGTDSDGDQTTYAVGGENGVASLDEAGKVKVSQLPDAVFGQLTFGGTLADLNTGICWPSSDLYDKLHLSDEETDRIYLLNQADDDVENYQYGWKTLKNVYFVVEADDPYAETTDIFNLDLHAGDWLLSTGVAWKKVDNTDAVTGVKGEAENSYRIGNVNITKGNLGLGNVDNVKQYSETNPPPYPVTSVAGRTGAVTLAKSDVGLGNVDNTSDLNKPISNATQNALNGKQAQLSTAQLQAVNSGITSGDVGQIAQNKSDLNNHVTDNQNPHGVTKAQVGLGNVDNTSDLNKPISNAQAAVNETVDTNITTLSNGLNSAEQSIQELDSDVTNLSADLGDLENEVADILDLIPTEATASNQLADKAYVDGKASSIEVQSTGYVTLSDTNSTGVPVLSAQQVTDIYNAISSGNIVYVKDYVGTSKMLMHQKALFDGKYTVYCDYLSRLELTYTVNGNTVDVSFKEIYDKSFLDNTYAPLSFVANLYGQLNTGNIIYLVDTAPTASDNNILQLSGSTNTEYDWNNPSVNFVRRIEVATTLSKTNSLTLTLKYKVSRPVTISWGAKIQYSTDNANWEDLSSNQSFNAIQITSAEGGISTDIAIFADKIVGTKTIAKDNYLRVLLFKKQGGATALTTNLYFGVNVDGAYVCTFGQFNFTNISINTNQIEDGSVTKPKLSSDLQSELEGKQNALDQTQLNAVNSGITSSGVAQISQNQSNLSNHITDNQNPHGVTKSQVGLGNVDNTSDLNKPISTATQTALNGKQATLVSGTNIKTINGVSILGSGDIPISSGATYTAGFGITIDSNNEISADLSYEEQLDPPTNVFLSGTSIVFNEVEEASGYEFYSNDTYLGEMI